MLRHWDRRQEVLGLEGASTAGLAQSEEWGCGARPRGWIAFRRDR